MKNPLWNIAGVIPPIRPGHELGSPRSPYRVSLNQFIDLFATSQERIDILKGFLGFRTLLHSSQIVSGFQWVDGSFMEHVEATQNRAPNDLDVVTFFNLPEDSDSPESFFEKNRHCFDKEFVKKQFKIDSFFVEMSKNSPEQLVKNSAYWYSVWGHTRSGLWKGFLEVDLKPSGETEALETLKKAGSK